MIIICHISINISEKWKQYFMHLKSILSLKSPFSAGQAESPPPAYSPRDDQAQQQTGMTGSQMDTGGNQVMDTSNSIMHSEPVAYEVRIDRIWL